ncbi:20881_t:CDS:2, partial [Entrophospora sp. SA101]
MSPKNPGPCVIEGCGSQEPYRGRDAGKKRRSEELDVIYIVEDVELFHILEDSTDDIEANFDYWSDIKVKRHEDNVTLSNEDFALL